MTDTPQRPRPEGTGIAGAMDYHPAPSPAGATPPAEEVCFVCGGPFKGGCSAAARVLPPLVQVCSKACIADPRFADPVKARRWARTRKPLQS